MAVEASSSSGEKAVGGLYPVFQTESSKPNARVSSVRRGRAEKPTKARRRSRQDLKLLWNDWLGARIMACSPIFDSPSRGVLREERSL